MTDGPDRDLESIVLELNAAVPDLRVNTERAVLGDSRLDSWLTRVRELGASDLLLVAGRPPLARASGAFLPVEEELLDGDDIVRHVRPVIRAALWNLFQQGTTIDAAFKRPGLGRFRINLHYERGRAAATIRALPTAIPELSALRFAHDISPLSRLPRGLVLIGGPTGSGKTTTLASLVALINSRDERHILTIEDPIEYEHTHGRSVIEQVEIGIDAPDFPTALRAAVRQAPDVIVVGEMRDPETMRIALSAAETGHLVFATVHTTDVAAAVSRIADAFPSERQNAIRQDIAMALAAVLTQSLVCAKDGTMFPIAELLMVGYGARQHIRKNALQHLNQEITITRKHGSFTLEESLARAVELSRLTPEDARLRAAHPEELDSLLKRPAR